MKRHQGLVLRHEPHVAEPRGLSCLSRRCGRGLGLVQNGRGHHEPPGLGIEALDRQGLGRRRRRRGRRRCGRRGLEAVAAPVARDGRIIPVGRRGVGGEELERSLKRADGRIVGHLQGVGLQGVEGIDIDAVVGLGAVQQDVIGSRNGTAGGVVRPAGQIRQGVGIGRKKLRGGGKGGRGRRVQSGHEPQGLEGDDHVSLGCLPRIRRKKVGVDVVHQVDGRRHARARALCLRPVLGANRALASSFSSRIQTWRVPSSSHPAPASSRALWRSLWRVRRWCWRWPWVWAGPGHPWWAKAARYRSRRRSPAPH